MNSSSNQTKAYDFKTRDIKVLKKLLPYLLKMRARVIWSVSFLMLAHKRTTLVIAHHLSTIVDDDQIIVLGNGIIVEQGKHQQLLDLNGQYARLWQIQVNKQTQG